MRDYIFIENGLRLVFRVDETGRIALEDLSLADTEKSVYEEKEVDGIGYSFEGKCPCVIALSGSGFTGQHGRKKNRAVASDLLRFRTFVDEKTAEGRRITLVCDSDELSIKAYYLFAAGERVLRVYAEVTAKKEVTVEYVSTLFLPHVCGRKEGGMYENTSLEVAHNTWHGELQWRKYTLSQLGLTGCHDNFSIKRICFTNTGTWSAKDVMPCGFLMRDDQVYGWQIEANGSWYFEVSNNAEGLYLALSGPTFEENAWFVDLPVGGMFTTVTAAVALTETKPDCIAALTKYRRTLFDTYEADQDLPPQYNGYMHSNWDFPTTERLLAQIDMVKALDIPYYIVDAGWFCNKKNFWNNIGDWLHPDEPFDGTELRAIFDHARAQGLKCGLWMEIEDVGAQCPNFEQLKPMLMKRRGKLVCDNERYFLDFSLPETRAYMDKVMHFVIEKYGVDYFKIDYNVDCPVGCDNNAESYGQGLLKHNRSYLAWVRSLHTRYPHIVMESCASGGMRLDYATVPRHALGNISDQIYYQRVPYILNNATAYLLPEHTGVWAYPLEGATDGEMHINFVNTALFRMQLSGPVETYDERKKKMAEEGIALYRRLCRFTRKATPFLPLGFAQFTDTTVAFGYQEEKIAYLAVYNLHGEKDKQIVCPFGIASARLLYPSDKNAEISVCGNALRVSFTEEEDACMVEMELL